MDHSSTVRVVVVRERTLRQWTIRQRYEWLSSERKDISSMDYSSTGSSHLIHKRISNIKVKYFKTYAIDGPCVLLGKCCGNVLANIVLLADMCQ